MKSIKNPKRILILLLCYLFTSCEDFLEVEVPNRKIASETVFSNDETALSAMAGIHNQLASVFFSSGGPDSVTILSGLSSDILSPIRSTNLPYLGFDLHEIQPNNFRNLNLWSSAYNMIYMTNSLLEGLADSGSISDQVNKNLEGQARFIRAFTYFYLVNLYGEVPLIVNTDYRVNALAVRNMEEEVYEQIFNDLEIAINLLEGNTSIGDRTHINENTAKALFARVHLYKENWLEAESLSSQIIAQTTTYEILEDLNLVFLANSREAIWQFSPEGKGSSLTNTSEGSTLIIHPTLSFLSHLRFTEGFQDSFGQEDKRFHNWISFHDRTGNYYSSKYKIRNSTDPVVEFSMVLRLAEQYLIRAEARAMLDNLPGAIADLDILRKRAGLELISEANPGISKDQILGLILEERKKELFTEWGHRWLDLKRTGMTGEILTTANPLWEETDNLYPIPETERMKNPNLTQNPGY